MKIYNYSNKKFHLKGNTHTHTHTHTHTRTHTDKRKSEKQPWKEDTLHKE